MNHQQEAIVKKTGEKGKESHEGGSTIYEIIYRNKNEPQTVSFCKQTFKNNKEEIIYISHTCWLLLLQQGEQSIQNTQKKQTNEK